MFNEEIHIYKAKYYYSAFPGEYGVYADYDTDNVNHRVIKGLCDSMVSVYLDRIEDTRHFYVSKKRYNSMCEAVERSENSIDNSKSGYNEAVECIEAVKEWIDKAIEPRVRGGCSRVM